MKPMKPNKPCKSLAAALAVTALLAVSATLTAQVTAVEFGGNYTNSNSNADTSGYLLENGDFDGEADADDRRGYIPFGTLFLNINDENMVGNNNKIYHGTQQTHLDDTSSDPAIGLVRLLNGPAADSLQCGHGGTTAVTQHTFAPHVIKEDFLNGANSTTNLLAFEDILGSVTVSVGGKTGAPTANHAMVRNGNDWYVSTTSSTSTNALSINGYTEMWIPYNPGSNIYVSASTLAGTPVAGSTLTDIQAFGAVIQQNNIASGRGGNADIFSVSGFSARLVPTPIPFAVDFSGDFISSNQNLNKALTESEEGDFNFDGNEFDLRSYRTIETGFGTIGNPNNLPNKTRTIHAGYQIATIGSFLDPPVPNLFRFNANVDTIQVTSGAVASEAAMCFTPHVRKENFTNGFSTNDKDLIFTDEPNAITIVMAQAASVDTVRALVQNGKNWYVSATEITGNTLTINGLTETWYPYDPSANQFIDTDNLSGGVSGSTLANIKAIGVFIQELSFDATMPNVANWQVKSIQAILGQIDTLTPSLQNFSIPKVTTTAPTIDGTLSPGEWDDAYKLDMIWPELGQFPNYGGVSSGNAALADPSDISGTLYFTWDDTYLYVGFDITDDVFIAPQPGGGGFPDDHFLFGFNPDTSTTGIGTTFLAEFFVNSNGAAEGFFRTTLGDTNLNVFTNHSLAGSANAEGWNFEMRLKWTDIKGDGDYVPAINDLFGTAVLLCDNDANDGTRDVFLYSAGAGNTSVMITPSLWHNVTLSASAPGNTYSDWIAGFPSVGAATGFNDDPDGDGIPNGVENFFGTRPDVFSKGLVAVAVNTATNTFTFTHPVNATPAEDLTATYRWSTDLSTFHDGGASNASGTTTVTFTPGTPSGGEVTVEAAITGSVIPDRLFVDVKVTQ